MNRSRRAAQVILGLQPDPIPRWRLHRDVLGSEQLAELRMAAEASRHVVALARTQQADGGFGPLHGVGLTRTEGAVARMVALGLEQGQRVMDRCVTHLCGLLDGSIIARDRPETNNRWATGFELFSAATLSHLKPDHPLLKEVRSKWRRILAESFADGAYSPDREIQAHTELTGANVAGSYLCLDNKYTVQLLATDRLEPDLRAAYFDWLWRRPNLRYLAGTPATTLRKTPTVRRAAWLSTQSLLSNFPEWNGAFRGHGADLWRQCNNGLWDLGTRRPNDLVFPLSESWRTRNARSVDWSVRCLLLLHRLERA